MTLIQAAEAGLDEQATGPRRHLMLWAEADIEVAGEAGSGPEAVALARTRESDVILMDLRMPLGDGVAATEQIVAADPAARVLVLTTYETDADILRAVEAGATGYLLKGASATGLANAVRAAARGETVLAPSVAERLVTHVQRPPRESLSGRETEILACVARGLTNIEIGRELFISEATVKTHLLRAFGKLGVSGAPPRSPPRSNAACCPRRASNAPPAWPVTPWSRPASHAPVTAARTRAASVRSGSTACAPAAVNSSCE